MLMAISKLTLIFITAPWKFYTNRQNHWCIFNVLWYKNWPLIGNKTANINVNKMLSYRRETALQGAL